MNRFAAGEAGQKPRTGRPRLTDSPEFLPRLYAVLPALADGNITVADAAKLVGCSRRSIRRYRDQPPPHKPFTVSASDMRPGAMASITKHDDGFWRS